MNSLTEPTPVTELAPGTEVSAAQIPVDAYRIDYQASCPSCKSRAMAFNTGHIGCVLCGSYYTTTPDVLVRLKQLGLHS